MKYNITNIQWDTDGKSPKKLKLPSSTIIDVPSDVNPEDFIADHLSDTYGFCVENYNYEPGLTKKQRVLKGQLQEMGYKVHITVDQGAIGAEVENWTKGGEDMLVWLKPFSLEELKSYAEDYDIDGHIELMMQDKGYKEHFTYREAIEDQENWLKELKQNIHNLEVLRGIFHKKEPEKKDEQKRIPDTLETVKALIQYRQINVSWWRDPEKTAERLKDFIGKKPLEVTSSSSETKTPSEDTVTVTLTATQQRQILDCLFDEKKRSGMQIARMDSDDRTVMSAYIESIDTIIKKLSA